jgi:ABC-type amino acid transport system permease subunit
MTSNLPEQRNERNQGYPLNRPLWWLFFLAATVLLSSSVEAFKTFTLVPDLKNGLTLALSLALLLVVMLTLAYDSYIKEKIRGGIRKSVPLFEWLYAKTTQGGQP